MRNDQKYHKIHHCYRSGGKAGAREAEAKAGEEEEEEEEPAGYSMLRPVPLPLDLDLLAVGVYRCLVGDAH